ncbi:MYXO-CTERM sorting domain-containing protein [Sorangium sp. So ce887]|uniref:MYXO-CTERM sorting domain-containing protein n=1 Tax=Sorangium sp. So ce887 TaxID=3133324 RepID=UPI003F5DBCB1
MTTRARWDRWAARLLETKATMRHLRPRTAALAGLAALGLGHAQPASATQLRFTTTAPGGIVATGNTLGLSKQVNANGPGVEDSIGTFLSLGGSVDDTPPNAANPWPAGTTADWRQNGSAAELVLPGELDVLYAELIWGGSYNYGDDVTAFLGTPVTLSTGGASMAASPDEATSVTLAEAAMSGFSVNYYLRSANVTAFVQAHGAGAYEVRGVPGTQNETNNSPNAAGWTLVVAYRDGTQPVRNLSVLVGGSFVDEDTQQDYVVSGFCAPPSGPIEGKVAISAIDGDADLAGDQLLLAPTVADVFVNLSGGNNPGDNFFCSQLNDADGKLDTRGTFGSANQDAIAGVNISGGRQGWDVTSVPVSSAGGQLVAGQRSAVIRTITTGDSFMPALAAFQIDVNAPRFTGGASSLRTSAEFVEIGDALTVTVTLDNQGQAAATNVRFKVPLQGGLALQRFTTDGVAGDAQGAPVAAGDLMAGVDAGDLAPGEQRTVVLELDVVGPPQGSAFSLHPTWGYEFVTCQGEPPLSESYGNFATVGFEGEPGAGGGGGGEGVSSGTGGEGGGEGVSSGTGGEGGSAGEGGAGAAPPGDSGDAGSDGGCGCATPGQSGRASASIAGAALLALAAATRRRRARRAPR